MKQAFVITWTLTVTILSAEIAAEEPNEKEAGRLAQIIRAVRENEELYRNLEITVEQRTDEADRETDKTTLHTVRQGDLIRFEGEEIRTSSTGEPVRRKRLSSFDGERTVSIEYGNSVNIHLGRYEASQVVPPHCWAVSQLGVNFPLSVLLGGIEAIHKHPKFRSHRIESGAVYEFAKVECRFEGVEVVEGMRCVKIRCRRWYRSTSDPVVSYLWLATERNYLCVKSQRVIPDSERVRNESVVAKFRRIAPGVWLPERVVTKAYSHLPDGQRTVRQRGAMELTDVVVEPAHPVAFFRQIDLPDNLPVFTVEDGMLKDSPVRRGAAASSDERLAEIVEAVRANEEHYANVETRTTEKYRLLAEGSHSPTFVEHVAQDATQRSLVMGGRVFFSEEMSAQLADATSSRTALVHAFDGEWTRTLHEYIRDRGGESTPRCHAALQQGQPESLGPYRPHTAALGATDEHRRLSEILTAETGTGLDLRQRHPKQKIEYLGTEMRDGFACEVLRLASIYPGREQPSSMRIVWLAKDRNYIPIRTEDYTLRWSERLPVAVRLVDDLCEIAPGLWFPFHVVTHRFEGSGRAGLAEGRLIVRWQREHAVEHVARDPEVPAEIFTTISVPAGTRVSVSDAGGESLGSFRQPATGNLSVSAEEYAAMKAHAEERKREKEQRIAAMDALVGQHAPAFPDAEWLNSKPLSWSDLAGKVVLLDFWAIWCGPCRGDLERLAKSFKSLNDSGIVVIGVHTAGSSRDDVEKLVEEENLGYPICIDTPPEEGRAWGTVFSRFAVRQLPHAYVIDKTGNVAAHGELQQVLAKAASLAK